MKEITLFAVTLLAVALAIYSVSSPPAEATPLAATFDYLNFNAECNKELEVECAIDVERTVVACAKAFETGAADIIADIKCAKDLLADKKHCWPCICA
jgi:hypothetical protein